MKALLLCFALGWALLASAGENNKGVVLSPQLTETLFQLGRAGQIKATVSPNHYPKEAANIPTVGFSFLPNFEKLYAAQPAWVLSDHTIANTPTERALSEKTLRWLHVDPNNVANFLQSVSKIERDLFGNIEVPLIGRVERCLNSLKGSGLSEFRFLGIAWVEPTILFGNRTFLADLFTYFGGTNLLEQRVTQTYPTVSFEWLAMNQPDVVFFISMSTWNQEKKIRDSLVRFWDFEKIRVINLNVDHFGRASFTPFFNLHTLASKLEVELPANCQGLQ